MHRHEHILPFLLPTLAPPPLHVLFYVPATATSLPHRKTDTNTNNSICKLLVMHSRVEDDHSAKESQVPRRKRATSGIDRDNDLRTTSMPRKEHTTSSSTLNARERFLRELEHYASDDEDEVAAVARSRGKAVVLPSTSLSPALRPQTLLGGSNGLPNPPSAAPTAAAVAEADNTDFFFNDPGDGGSLHAHDDDTTEHADSSRHNDGTATTATTRSHAPRVGLRLLQRMHAESAATSHNNSVDDGGARVGVGTALSTFTVVHTYVPLSTGGFLSTASAGDDLMEGRQVRVGDVLSLRKPHYSTTTTISQPSEGLSLASSVVPKAGGPHPQIQPSLPSSSPSSAHTAPPGPLRFKPAASFTDNEVEYGRRLSPDMVRRLCEVTRVDSRGRTVEALFLDGTRAKLPYRDVRPAGYDEQKRYVQWKADPASRPVPTMHSGSPSSTSFSAPGAHPTSSTAVSATDLAGPVAVAGATQSPSGSAAALPWWVIPRLLVRVATEAAGDWYGKKCVVNAVRRSDNAIRLTEWQDEAVVSTHRHGNSSGAPTLETRELIGVDGLETVVPKKGGRAMIVLGPKKGEMCTVRSRVRGPDGDLTGVEVEISRTKEVVTLHAEELCALAR
jgi:hypothetical protein